MKIDKPVAVALDAAGIAIFVMAGRQSHEIGGGVVWFLTVFWPFAAGWFAVALLTNIYNQPKWSRLAVTWLGGTGVGFVLRAVVTGRATPIAFILVGAAFIAAINLGWRAIWAGAVRVANRA